MVLIALDYDGTYTADPDMWNEFISSAKMHGHEIYCVTMRIAGVESFDVERALSGRVDKIIYTNRKAKKQSVRMQCNRDPDIWIDDNPDWLYEDAL